MEKPGNKREHPPLVVRTFPYASLPLFELLEWLWERQLTAMLDLTTHVDERHIQFEPKLKISERKRALKTPSVE